MAITLTSLVGADTDNAMNSQDKLAPCPNSYNCVSTQSKRKTHGMEPLPYLETRENSKERILSILQKARRTEVVRVTEHYIHAEFRTFLWGFVDDVEFVLDDEDRVIHFRSASRVGYYDFGLNRRRMRAISELYFKK